MKKLLKDPLLHFLLIGAALFVSFELFSDPTENQENTIVVTRGDIAALQANFARTWQRQPTPTELTGLIEDKIRGEIAFREAVAMGLDQDDSIIKRRLRMKMELLVEDVADLSPPTDDELTAFLHENRDDFREKARLSFAHVYVNPDTHGAAAMDEAQSILGELTEEGGEADPELYGDPILLAREISLSPIDIIARQFGEQFSNQLQEVEPDTWAGPLRSSYGLHLVYVRQKVPARDPDLSEIRSIVEREWIAQRRKEVKEQTYQKLRQQYTVLIEEQPDSDA